MSSSATALAAARLGNQGHESRQLEDLFGALGRRQLAVIPSQSSTLGPPVGRPIPGSPRVPHSPTVLQPVPAPAVVEGGENGVSAA